jgi:type IV pilus assembly protein PilN
VNGPLNLASRPFRNERLPRLLLGAAWVAVLALTAIHALLVRELLPERTSARHVEAQQLEDMLRTTAARVAASKADVSLENLKLWSALKAIVDGRTFSWTLLLGDLEQVVPPGIRIASLNPQQKDGRTLLKLEALVRKPEESLDFLHALELRPQFSLVYPLNVSEDNLGLRHVNYSMLYEPQAGVPQAETEATVEPAAALEAQP